MENHGITMKGKFFMEEVSSPAEDPDYSEKRIIYNVSGTINGAADYFGQFKMYFHNNVKWLRPLVANKDDGPDIDGSRSLGNGARRFAGIYSKDFYGAVRYS